MLKNNESKVYNKCFYFAYFLLLISTYCLSINVINNILTYVKLFSISLFLMLFLYNIKRIKKRAFFVELLLLALSFAVSIISHSYTLLFLMIIVFAFKGFDLDDFIKKDIKYRSIISIFVFLCFLLGITKNTVFYRYDLVRYSFGFPHPNMLAYTIVIIFLEYLYISRKKINIIKVLLCVPIIIINSIIVNNRSSILFMVLTCLLFLFLKNNSFKKIVESKIGKFIIKNSYLIFSILSLLLLYEYMKQSEIGLFFNQLLSSRISSILKFLNEYGISIFGKNILLIGSEEALELGVTARILDNSYFHILIHFGFVMYMVLFVLFRKTIDYFYKKNELYVVILFFSFFILGLSESYLFKIEMNAFLVFISVIFNSSIKNDE